MDQENSYSFIMRKLRKDNPEKAIAFQVAFKNAFDDAFLNDLENLDKIALLQAIKDVGI